MKKIVDPILCIFALIRVIYYCNNVAILLVDIENQTAFIQLIDIYTLLTLYVKVFGILKDL